MPYLLLKFLHILAAIAAVGTNLTYGAWIVRGKREPQALAFALRGIRFLDNRVANPAYVALLITGLGLAHVGKLPLTTPWLLAALVLYAGVALVGMLGYTPTLRRQVEALERSGFASAEFAALARRGHRLGAAIGVLVLAILFLMVCKPSFGA